MVSAGFPGVVAVFGIAALLDCACRALAVMFTGAVITLLLVDVAAKRISQELNRAVKFHSASSTSSSMPSNQTFNSATVMAMQRQHTPAKFTGQSEQGSRQEISAATQPFSLV